MEYVYQLAKTVVFISKITTIELTAKNVLTIRTVDGFAVDFNCSSEDELTFEQMLADLRTYKKSIPLD